MPNAREQMNIIDAELARLDREIAKLQTERAALARVRAQMGGEPEEGPKRRRAPNVKPVVLDYMDAVGPRGATSAEVDEAVRKKVPTVAKDTVASVLSRLKGDEALAFDGERYYVKRHAPEGAFAGIRVVK